MNQLVGGQLESWVGLLELSKRTPEGWTLIGGQLVQLHCWERGVTPSRVTDDIDAVLDVISNPNMLLTFTSTLKELGFSPETYASGHQLKWRRRTAEIDVLLPNAMGERALRKTGISGGTTIETPGGRKVLDFSQKVLVQINDRQAVVNRPHLLGAIFIKSAALQNPLDHNPERHLLDLAVLTAMFTSEDAIETIDKKSTAVINSAIGRLKSEPALLARVSGSLEGLERLNIAINQ